MGRGASSFSLTFRPGSSSSIVSVLIRRKPFPLTLSRMDLPSKAEIESKRTPKGGFTRQQLAAWGVPWPPPKGWLADLLKGKRPEPEPAPIATDVASRCHCPEPDSPDFDSCKHGLLAPPIVTLRRG
jgi:hypothetical protein